MAQKIQIKRGLEANLGSITLADGEFAVTTDTKKLYVGVEGAKICLGGASSLGDMLKSIYDTDNDGIVDCAEKLATGRNIAITGDVIGNAVFDGSANIAITTTLKTGLTWNDLKGV